MLISHASKIRRVRELELVRNIVDENENDVLFSNDIGKLGKRNSECSYQESNLRPSVY